MTRPQPTPGPLPERLSVGRLLDTPITRRWSAEERRRANEQERREVYAGFRADDEGRSRELVAKCGGYMAEQIAAELVRRWNAHEELLAACEYSLVRLMRAPGGVCCVCQEPYGCTEECVVPRLRAAITKATP